MRAGHDPPVTAPEHDEGPERGHHEDDRLIAPLIGPGEDPGAVRLGEMRGEPPEEALEVEAVVPEPEHAPGADAVVAESVHHASSWKRPWPASCFGAGANGSGERDGSWPGGLRGESDRDIESADLHVDLAVRLDGQAVTEVEGEIAVVRVEADGAAEHVGAA